MNREEAEQRIKAEAVAIWKSEHFTGSRADARRLAEKRLGITLDMFPEVERTSRFYTLPGELFT